MKLKNGMIIKCNSKEDAQEFINEAYKQGFKWVNDIYANEKTCWCAGYSEIYYHLKDNLITWSTMYSGNNSIEYSTLKGKNIMTKSDLKNGMVVEARNGDKGIVYNDQILFKYMSTSIDNLKDNLETDFPITEDSYSIDKIYIIKYLYCYRQLSNFDDDNLKLIWERTEDFKVGDIVRVVEKEKSYDTYIDFFIEQDLPIDYAARYVYHHLPDEESKYRILHIGKHDYKDNDVIVVESVKTNEIYLVDSNGIEIYKKITKNYLQKMKDAV